MVAVKRYSKPRRDPLDLTVEDPFYLVSGWPLSVDEVSEVAVAIGCKPKALMTTPALPASVWRRLGGPIPQIIRSLDIRLVAALIVSSGHDFVDYIHPAAWIERSGECPFVYGAKHFLDGSTGPRKGAVRTATFIGEDPWNANRIAERFISQCIEDFCADGTRIRLQRTHGHECLEIVHNGPSRSARFPDHDWCERGCVLCEYDFLPDGNRRAPTTWRKLFHRAERFLAQWELVRINTSNLLEQQPRFREFDGWPLWRPE